MMPLWMSEEEAKQRWCPYFRDTIEGMGSYSRIDQRELKQQEDGTKKWVTTSPLAKECCCIASDCMAWRWARTHIADEQGNLTISSTDTHGFCGLAG